MNKAYIVVGLGFGDEGKGATVDYICDKTNIDLVVRFSGGSQCTHNVIVDGKKHTFAQWGSGTLRGIPTYLGPEVVINPPAMEKEAKCLSELGIINPKRLLMVDPSCLVTTRYHRLINQIKELRDQHGSCAHGIGQVKEYYLKYGMDSLFAEDLYNKELTKIKCKLLRDRSINWVEYYDNGWNTKQQILINRIFNDPINEIVDELTGLINLETIDLTEYNNIVFEGTQGILLDERFGFHPHTTWSTVTNKHALEIVDGLPFEIINIGCIRSYMTRHGNGPFPTKIGDFNDPGNEYNEWQGQIKWGDLDLVLLRYAIECNGGIDYLSVSHLDQMMSNRVCVGYKFADHEFNLEPQLIPSLDYQQGVGITLKDIDKEYVRVENDEELIGLIEKELGKVLIKGYGPSSDDRVRFFNL
jgi:adenylosuccinate synthase